MDTRAAHIASCELGEMRIGRLAECLLALKILDIRLVLVRRAAYTTVKQNPVPNLEEKNIVNRLK